MYIIATYGEDGTPDAMNAAWGGISEQNEISLCLSAGHKTVKNILKRGAFTVSMAEAGHITACDYVGLVSGNNTPDKFTRAGFHAVKSEFVDAPLIEELSKISPVIFDPFNNIYLKVGEKVGNAFSDGRRLK